MGRLIEQLRREQAGRAKAESVNREKKVNLLADAKKRQTLVASFTSQFQQGTKVPKVKRFNTRIEAIEDAAKGTATSGYAAEVDKMFTQALSDRTGKLKNVTPKEMLYNIGTRLLEAPRKGGSILERAHKAKLSADTGVTNFFGAFGEDKDVKALPGYAEYKESVLGKEVESHYTNPLLSGAIGAVTSAAGIGIKKAIGQKVLNTLAKVGVQKFAGRTLLATPNPYAKVAGAALLAVPSFAGFELVQNVIDKSDWGKAREGTWEKTAVELAGGIAGGGVAGKFAKTAFTKSLTKATEKGALSRAALNFFKKSGGEAKDAINLGFAQRREANALAKFNSTVGEKAKVIKGDLFNTVKAAEIVGGSAERERLQGVKKLLPKTSAEKQRLAAPATVAREAVKGEKFSLNQAKTRAEARVAGTAKVNAFTEGEQESIVAAVFPKMKESERLLKVRKLFSTAKTSSVVKEKKISPASAFRNLSPEATDYALRESQTIGIVAATKKAVEIENVKAFKNFASTLPGMVKEKVTVKNNLVKSLTDKTAKVDRGNVFRVGNGKEKVETVSKEIEKVAVNTGLAEKERITGIKNLLKKIAVPTLGLASVASLFSPDEAEAGIADTLAKTGVKMSKPAVSAVQEAMAGSTKEGKVKLLSQFAKSGLGAKTVIDETSLTAGTRMSHSALDVANLAAGLHGSVDRSVTPLGRGKIPGVIFNALTPGSKGEFLYKKGANPLIEVAHGQTATDFNVSNALKVVDNIAKKVPGLGTGGIQTSKEIVAATEGLAKKHSASVVEYGMAKFKEEQLDKSYNRLFKLLQKAKGKNTAGKERALRILEEDIITNKRVVNSLSPKYKEYVKEATVMEQDLAKKYATSRISFAVEDTPDFKHRPWLKEMLTFEEKAAVKEFRNFYDSYAVSIKEVGGRVITERPFVHHAFHPAWKEPLKEANTLQAGSAAPFSKFFRRAQFSRQSVPDILYNTSKYVPDTERRLQWKSFWGKGRKLENGKADRNTWWNHRNKLNGIVQNSDDLSKFWRGIEDATKPFADSWGNKLANKYSSFEVARLLAFIPSPGFKHAFKLIGQAASMGIGNYSKHVAPAIKTAIRGKIGSSEGLSKLIGRNPSGKEVGNLLENMSVSMTHQGRMMNNLADLEVGAGIDKVTMRKWDKLMESWNYYGSVPIRMVEYVDRTHTFLASLDMAAKKGMTAQQAAYGFYSTSLKNNFMGQSLNPRWMRDPKIRAMMLFQQTPFKVLDRRVTTAIKAGKALSLATREGKKIYKEEGLVGLLKDLKVLKDSVIEGETSFKRGLIYDAMKTEKDFFGTSASKQFMRESLIVGGMIYGGAKVFDLDLSPHTMHLPFLGFHGAEPSVALNPGVKAFFKTMQDRKMAYNNSEEYDFFIPSFLQAYLGSTNYMPSIINKAARLSDNDIPDIYNDSPLKYLFAVPTKSLSHGSY